MQINLTGHHVDVTDSLRNYVENKFERLERHFDNVTNVHVIISVEKLRQSAEATLYVNGTDVFADAVHEDMYAAIDALIDKLDRQVRKVKEKKTNHRSNNGLKNIEHRYRYLTEKKIKVRKDDFFTVSIPLLTK